MFLWFVLEVNTKHLSTWCNYHSVCPEYINYSVTNSILDGKSPFSLREKCLLTSFISSLVSSLLEELFHHGLHFLLVILNDLNVVLNHLHLVSQNIVLISEFLIQSLDSLACSILLQAYLEILRILSDSLV